MLAKEPDSSSVKSARDRESRRDRSAMQEERLSKKTKRMPGRPNARLTRKEDAREEKLAKIEKEATAKRTELSAKLEESKGERQGSLEEREGR